MSSVAIPVGDSDFMRLLIPLAILAALSTPAWAETRSSAVYDITLRGIRGAVFSFGSIEDAGRYSTTGTVKTSGILSAIRKISYFAKSQGAKRGTRYIPSTYEESRTLGGDSSGSRITYRGGVPQTRVYDPPRPNYSPKLDYAEQGGTVDPMTAAFAVFRDMPKDEVCTFSSFLFDGTRRAQVVTGSPKAEGNFLICDAEYRRIDGYSEREINEEGTRFAFKLTYGEGANGLWHVKRVDMNTTYGRGSMVRR